MNKVKHETGMLNPGVALHAGADGRAVALHTGAVALHTVALHTWADESLYTQVLMAEQSRGLMTLRTRQAEAQRLQELRDQVLARGRSTYSSRW